MWRRTSAASPAGAAASAGVKLLSAVAWGADVELGKGIMDCSIAGDTKAVKQGQYENLLLRGRKAVDCTLTSNTLQTTSLQLCHSDQKMFQ